MTRAEFTINLLARITASPPGVQSGRNDAMKIRMLVTMAITEPKGYMQTRGSGEYKSLQNLLKSGYCHTRTFGERIHYFLTDKGRGYVNALLR